MPEKRQTFLWNGLLFGLVLLCSFTFLSSCKKKPTTASAPVAAPTPGPKMVHAPGPIVFVSKYQNKNGIWLYNQSTKAQELMLAWPEELKYPTWSPDGKSVAFFGKEKTKWRLYSMDAAAKKPLKLTLEDDLQAVTPPQWSLDGK